MRNVLVVIAALAACNNPPAATPEPAPDAQPSGAPAEASPIGVTKDPGEKVFSVNGRDVGQKELEIVFMRMQVPPAQLAEFAWTPEGRHVAEEYALVTALFDDAAKAKLWEDPEVQRQLAFFERQVLAAAMRERLAKAAVTDQAVNSWYEANKARFDKPEVKARHIQVASEDLAKELMERIKKGEAFADLAKTQSSDQASAPKGGEVGWYQEQENRLFGAQSFAAEKGALIGPIQSTAGWHIVEVLDKRDKTPIEDVRPIAEVEIARIEAPNALKSYRAGLHVEWVREPAPMAPSPPGGDAPPGELPHGPGGPGGPGKAPHGPGGPGKAPHGPGGPGKAPGGGAGR